MLHEERLILRTRNQLPLCQTVAGGEGVIQGGLVRSADRGKHDEVEYT